MYSPGDDFPRNWTRNELIALMREVIRVDFGTTSEYTGNPEGPMFENVPYLKLVIDGEEQ